MSIFRKVLSAFDSKPKARTSELSAQQSDWTIIDDTLVKKWGVTGVLDSGDEFVVMIEINFSRSNVDGGLDPHVFINLFPNTIGNVEGQIVLQVARSDSLADYPVVTAMITSTDRDSILITPMDRSATNSIIDVLSDMQFFRITIHGDNAELLFQLSLPNSTNNFSKVFGTAFKEQDAKQKKGKTLLSELMSGSKTKKRK
jgi:hypothetical protein